LIVPSSGRINLAVKQLTTAGAAVGSIKGHLRRAFFPPVIVTAPKLLNA
jgi:hypothetical protein